MKKIGRIEKINFTNLSEETMSCKIDTGAWSAALHVESAEIVDGELVVKMGNNQYAFKKWKEINVKSSNGLEETRFGLKLRMRLGGKGYWLFVGLTNRGSMKYPVLIGRKFLRQNNFLVDVNKKNINGRT